MQPKETKKMDRIQKMEAFVTKLKDQEIAKHAKNLKTNEKLKKFQQLREFKEDEKSESEEDDSEGSSSSIDSEQERILMKKLKKRQEKKKLEKLEKKKGSSNKKDDINNLYKDIQKEKRKEVEVSRRNETIAKGAARKVRETEMAGMMRKASAVAPADSGSSSGEQNTKPVQRIRPSRYRQQ